MVNGSGTGTDQFASLILRHFSGSLGGVFKAWNMVPFRGWGLLIWNLIPHAILLVIWKERNDMVFCDSASSWQHILKSVLMKVGKQAIGRNEFLSFILDIILFNWEACLVCGLSNSKKAVRWCSLLEVVLKFNVDGAARGNLGPTGIGDVLRNFKGEVLISFLKSIGVGDSIKAEGLAHPRGIRKFILVSFMNV